MQPIIARSDVLPEPLGRDLLLFNHQRDVIHGGKLI